MRAFDAESYVKTVLTPAASGAPMPDLFARYLLEPGDEDKDAIKLRMAAVKAHWDKLESKNNAKYAAILTQLIHAHTVAGLTLLSAVERRRAAEEIRAKRTEAERRRGEDEEKFERQVSESVARDGGLTPRSRRILEEFARGLELDQAAVSARLDACPAIAEHTDVEPLAGSVRTRIRQALTGYAAATETPSLGISLFHALRLPGPEHDRAKLESTWREQSELHRSLNVENSAKIPMANVLGFAKVHLIDEDPAIYVATLVEEVLEILRPRAAGAALDGNAIDELESEQLVREAQEHGLASRDARDLVSRIAVDLGVELRLGAVVDYIACAGCNRPHHATGAPEHCTRCGRPLFTTCPECQARHPASDTACSACGTNLAAHARSLQLLSDAELALRLGEIALAAKLMAQIPGGSDDESSKTLAAAIDRAIKSARSEWDAIEREIGERRLYTAISHLARLEQTAADVRGPGEAIAAERRATIAERLRAVEALLSRARGQSPGQQEQSFARVLEQAADCREAEQQLARTAPLPPSEVQAAVQGSEVMVSWKASPSPGPVRYRVTRNPAQAGPDMDVEITTSLHASDPQPPTGESVRYGVVSERAGRPSQAAFSVPLFVVRDIEELAVAERDGEVRLTWAPVESVARVEVQRTDEAGNRRRLTAERDGLVDSDVQAGDRYEYRIRVAYARSSGDLVHTEGRVVFAKSAPRPEPVCDLVTDIRGTCVRIRCDSPRAGTVIVLRCPGRPEVAEGEELAERDLERIGEELPRDSEGAYDPTLPASAWYLPIAQSGAYLIAGRATRHLALPPIVDVRAVDLGAKVRVTWAWPEQTRAAIVAWRRDRQPIDAEDERATHLAVTQAQYADQGGVELSVPGRQPVFLAVFAATRVDGDLLGASTCDRRARLVVARSSRVDVRYVVRRSGLRRRRVCFEILEPEQALPELVLVAKQGELLPRSAEDGRVIANLGGESGDRRCELDLDEFGRPVTIRMFVRSVATGVTHRLRDPDTRELVFR